MHLYRANTVVNIYYLYIIYYTYHSVSLILNINVLFSRNVLFIKQSVSACLFQLWFAALVSTIKKRVIFFRMKWPNITTHVF